ncbi:hypothetical protein V8E53_004492 [Lactarius tabidus]
MALVVPSTVVASIVSSTVAPVVPSETASMLPSTDVSGLHRASSKKASKKVKKTKKEAHQSVPSLKIRVLQQVAAMEPATLGKRRALSPEEGQDPSSEHRGHKYRVSRKKKGKQPEPGPTHTYPPPLVLIEEEVAPGPTLSRSDSLRTVADTSVAALPVCGRKLRRTETLLSVDPAEQDSSPTFSSDSDSDLDSDSDSDSFSSKDVECPPPAQMTAFAQRVALERPSWMASVEDNTVHKGQHKTESGPSSTPGIGVVPLHRGANLQVPLYHAPVDVNSLDPEIIGVTSSISQASHPSSEGDQGTDLGFSGEHAALQVVNGTNVYWDNAGPASGGDQACPEPGPAALQEWPAETNLQICGSKIKLMDQSRIIRDMITRSFPFLRASIVLENSFPDPLLTASFVMRALVTAATVDPNAVSIGRRLQDDHVYLSKMIVLPQARISLFRTEVKERCAASVALLVNVHDSQAVLADLIKKQIKDNYNYIFPRRSNGNILSGVPLRSHPYCSTIIISVIRDLFFSGCVSFVARHQSLFPSHRGPDGVVSWEVPKTMVALVATGLFAALKEWGTGEHKHYDFTANMNTDAYDGHILSLNKIEAAQNGFYHCMMADIYHLASSNTSQAAVLVPALDMSMLEFFEE